MKRNIIILTILSVFILGLVGCGEGEQLFSLENADDNVIANGEDIPIGGPSVAPDNNPSVPVEDGENDSASGGSAPARKKKTSKSKTTSATKEKDNGKIKIMKKTLGTLLLYEPFKATVKATGASNIEWSIEGNSDFTIKSAGIGKAAYIEGTPTKPLDGSITVTASDKDNPAKSASQEISYKVSVDYGVNFYKKDVNEAGELMWLKLENSTTIEIENGETLRAEVVARKKNSDDVQLEGTTNEWSSSDASLLFASSEAGAGSSVGSGSVVYINVGEDAKGVDIASTLTVSDSGGNSASEKLNLYFKADPCKVLIEFTQPDAETDFVIDIKTESVTSIPVAIGAIGGSGTYAWNLELTEDIGYQGLSAAVEEFAAEGEKLDASVSIEFTGAGGLGTLPLGDSYVFTATATDSVCSGNEAATTFTVNVKKGDFWEVSSINSFVVAGMNQIHKDETEVSMDLEDSDGNKTGESNQKNWADSFNGGKRNAKGNCYFDSNGRHADDSKCGKKVDFDFTWNGPKDISKITTAVFNHHDKGRGRDPNLWVHVIQLEAVSGNTRWCADVRYEGHPGYYNTWDCGSTLCEHPLDVSWQPCSIVENDMEGKWMDEIQP